MNEIIKKQNFLYYFMSGMFIGGVLFSIVFATREQPTYDTYSIGTIRTEKTNEI
jgi:hypothetical protein